MFLLLNDVLHVLLLFFLGLSVIFICRNPNPNPAVYNVSPLFNIIYIYIYKEREREREREREDKKNTETAKDSDHFLR